MAKKISHKEQRIKWWQDARFGMFIHWGLYSVDGLDCWKMYDMGTPIDEYIHKLAPRFTAKKYNANKFAELAKSAGCKYVILTAKHHEGFCLWDTETTKLSSMHMTPQRDIVAEYVEAMRSAGIKVGIYYSLLDWRYKAYFDGPRKNPEGWEQLTTLIYQQVRELMTKYGKIDILWYDGSWPNDATVGGWGYTPTCAETIEAWKSKRLNAMVRRCQPDILINNRASRPFSGGDFGTPEQEITPEDRPWEMCDTLGHLWGAASQDLNRKNARDIVTRLISCVAFSGNMLLNIGPNPDGTIQKWQSKIMEQVGDWLKKHGEAIYGCEGEWASPFSHLLSPWRTTRKGNNLYLHLLHYPGVEFSIANLHGYYLKSACILDTDQRLKIVREPTRTIIKGLPEKSPDPIATVIKINIRPATSAEKKKSSVIGFKNPETETVSLLQ